MNSVCVYCGASSGSDTVYIEAAKLLGMALLAQNCSLIYGGARVGLMGILADTVLQGTSDDPGQHPGSNSTANTGSNPSSNPSSNQGASPGKVIGVIPRNLFRNEVPHGQLTEMIYVDTMHERKALMAERADCFIALPGGLGTVEELLEILTWSQLKIHHKPCGLLNVAGFYDSLLNFLDHSTDQGFIQSADMDSLLVDDDPSRLLASLLKKVNG